MTLPRPIRAGVAGFGWMGQAHGRSLRRAPTVLQDAGYRRHLVAVANGDANRRGWTTINGRDRFPYHGAFVPGGANRIGSDDPIAIEDHEFCLPLAKGRVASLTVAVAALSVQETVMHSAASGRWEQVHDLPSPDNAGVAARSTRSQLQGA